MIGTSSICYTAVLEREPQSSIHTGQKHWSRTGPFFLQCPYIAAKRTCGLSPKQMPLQAFSELTLFRPRGSKRCSIYNLPPSVSFLVQVPAPASWSGRLELKNPSEWELSTLGHLCKSPQDEDAELNEWEHKRIQTRGNRPLGDNDPRPLSRARTT